MVKRKVEIILKVKICILKSALKKKIHLADNVALFGAGQLRETSVRPIYISKATSHSHLTEYEEEQEDLLSET